jgi:dihydroxyacetone kinase
MAGISISVLGLRDEWLRWLDAETAAPAWPNVSRQRPGKPQEEMAGAAASAVPSKTLTPPQGAQPALEGKTRHVIELACQALIAAEPELTELDRITGDGDLGTNMERAAKAVLAQADGYPLGDLPETLKQLGRTLQREMGGTSGPLYGIFFLRCGSVLAGSGRLGMGQWAEAVQQGCTAISELGGAKPGDRTMLDALAPFAKAFKEGWMMMAVEEAERGVAATAGMKPMLGRSSYLGDRVLGHPDPGAKAAWILLRAVCEAVLAE